MKNGLIKLVIIIGSFLICSTLLSQSFKITYPNGGENIAVGSDLVITWEGIEPEDTIRLEFSINDGKTWELLSEDATDLKYEWKNIPKLLSNRCLIRAQQIEYNNGHDIFPQIQWQRSFGGSSADMGVFVLQTSDDGYIVAGTTKSDDGDITEYKGDYDYWIVKLNYTGELQWQKTFGGSRREVAFSIVETYDNDFVVAGYTESENGDVTNHKGYWDFWILRLNPLGDIKWQRTYGGTGLDWARSIYQTSDGGFIIGGQSSSNDGDLIGNNGGAEYWVVKLNQIGDIEWDKTFGGSNSETLHSFIKTNDGGYIMAGWTRSDDGDVTGFKGGFSDYWVVKTDSLGNLEWQKTLGGSGDDYAKSIVQAVDGGYIVAGSTLSDDGDVTGYKDSYDYWIVKLGPKGNLEWQKTLGGSKRDQANSVITTFDGGCIVVGYTDSQDGDVDGKRTRDDVWIVKLDDSGQLIWQKTMGGSMADEIAQIIKTNDGGYALVGGSESRDVDLTKNNGSKDMWIVKLTPGGTILNEDIADSVFSIVEPIFSSLDIDMGMVNEFDKKDSLVAAFVINYGSWEFRIDTIFIRGTDASAFSLLSGFTNHTIGPGESHQAGFRFAPIKSGYHQAFIVIKTQSQSLIKNITGVGVGGFTSVSDDSGLNGLWESRIMSISPNPVENKLNVEFLLTERGYAEISLYNILGEKVETLYSENVNEFNEKVVSSDISDLSSGNYILILKTPTSVQSSPLMILK